MAVLNAALAALNEALAGHGKVIMLAGEPGIGKTRLAQELARKAKERGVRVLWRWGYEGEGAPPYWPWVNSIRNYVQGTNPSLRQTQLGSGTGPVAEMIPEILGILDGVEPTLNMEPDQARFRLFDAATGCFRQGVAVGPLWMGRWRGRSRLLGSRSRVPGGVGDCPRERRRSVAAKDNRPGRPGGFLQCTE